MELTQLMELRLDFWSKWLTSLLIVVMNYFVWTTAFASKQVYAGYTLESIVGYFIVASFLYNIVLIHRQETIGRDIVEGALVTYLVKPVSYPWQMFTRAMLNRVVYTVIGTLMLYVVSFFIIPFTLSNASYLLWGIAAIIIATILYTCIDFLLGISSFWLARSFGPKWLLSTIIMLTSGLMFPTDVLPSWLSSFLYLTPFPYIIYFPTSTLVGHFDTSALISSLLVGLIWCIALILGARLAWRRGLRHFEGSGI